MDNCAPRLAKISLGLACAACATTAPHTQLHDTCAFISRVESAGAVHTPELALAREKLALAQRYLAAGEDKIAGWLLEQARADAELGAIEVWP